MASILSRPQCVKRAPGHVCLTVLTKITSPPQDVHIALEEVRFNCEASSDDSTPVLITWKKDDTLISMERDPRITITATDLIITLVGLSLYDIDTNYKGDYVCVADNGYSDAKAKATLRNGKGL